ncbi:MAG: hypothetical protein KGZ83_20225 [Sulfuricella sp.]|nr:hypothetical protein [Sulfuricella sp.]
MSGPIAVSYSLSGGAVGINVAPLGTVFLAAAALQEAQAMGQEYAEALASVTARSEQLAEKRRRHQEAQTQQRAAVEQEATRLESRLNRLQGIAASLAERLPEQAASLASGALRRPPTGHAAAMRDYAEALRNEIRRLEILLDTVGHALDSQLRDTLALAMQTAPQAGLDDLLQAYAAQRNLRPGLNLKDSAAFRHTVERVLSRLELAAGEAVPRELETLAREILLAPTLERAETLAVELRLRVQRYQEERKRLREDAEEINSWLAVLPDEAPAELRAALELAAAGVQALPPAVEAAARQMLAEVRQAREKQEQEAAALVLQQSLRDLGYAVDDIENTLFVEGGVVHFQRQGWEDYYVRLRLDPRENTVNFNVVRPRGLEESAVRKRLDFLAEERWCAEFPKLQQTLAARGIASTVTRQLGAGELPVQSVDPASLPQRREEDALRASQAPLQKGFS